MSGKSDESGSDAENSVSSEHTEVDNEQNESDQDNNNEGGNGNDFEVSDSGSDIITGSKRKQTTSVQAADLFGDEVSDLSGDDDDEDEQKDTTKKSEDRDLVDEEEEDEDEDRMLVSKTSLIAEEEEEHEEEQIINVEIPRVKADLGKDLHFVKLPNFLSVESKPFDPEFYEDESANADALDEEGKTRVKLKVENTIRWRNGTNEAGELVKESNARMVRWSDGSLSLHLGNEIFDVYKQYMQGDYNHLFLRQGTGLQAQAVFRTKLAFRPYSLDSLTHRKMTMSVVDRGSKIQKVKMLTNPVTITNPEAHRVEMIKKEEEKLKAATRREQQQRRLREKQHSKSITSSYLEDRYSDEDESTSLNAIKNKYKSGHHHHAANKNSIYSSTDSDDDDDESDRERRLNKAKISQSDQSDDEHSQKKKKKRVVADDDDDDNE